jgi:ABC-2 type transport system permease protein
MLLLLVVILAAVISTVSRVQTEDDARRSMQVAAEEAFLAQPARHPHRMVHYGHYVFRTPAPLAIVDPGVDPRTGTVLFLEGHRQNTATFPAAYTAPQVAGFRFLTPAFTYQVLVPLVLIVVGFSAVARERELQTDVQLTAQGVSPVSQWMGKSLALLSLSALLLLPLAAGVVLAMSQGESAATGVTLLLGYFAYLAFWSFAIIGISSRAKSAAMALLWCCVTWVVVAVLAPRVASDLAGAVAPATGKIESDFALIEELRELGDGHNAADPAFDALRAEIMNQYGVEREEDLPVNMRGIVAEASEANLTEVLNRYAEARMDEEIAQATVARGGAVLSPMLAVRNVSLQTAGSDLENHHRFLREAEAARFDFVQSLNRAHATELAYVDDVNRNIDEASGQKARISADNWRVLQSFDFQPAPAAERVRAALPSLLLLLLWCVVAAAYAYLGMKNTEGRLHAR